MKTKDHGTMRYYVYTLRFPDNTVFYVGEGTGDRVNMHERQALNLREVSLKSAAIIDTYLNDETIIKQIEAWFVVKQHALIYEAMLIEAYGLENLTNVSSGIKTRSLEVTDVAACEYEDTTEDDIQEMVKIIEQLDDKAELLPDTNDDNSIKVRIQKTYSKVWSLYGEYRDMYPSI